MTAKRILGIALVLVGLGVVISSLSQRRGLNSDALTIETHPDSNVLLITLDTTRADHIGVYGGDAGVTPAMDQLATEGVTFMEMQAVSPITLPSHTSMLTGLNPHEHGVRNNGMFSVPQEIESLAEVYRDAGYATGAFVSAAVLDSRYGLDSGFEIYDDDLSRGSHLVRFSVPARRGDLTTEAALKWLDELPKNTPFFCWIHYYDPHAPYSPPPEYRERYPDNPYLGEIAFTDDLVGRVVDFLEDRQLRDSTYLSVVADHGEALGEHGEKTHAILLHQATTKVPWILTGPGVPQGTKYPSPTSGADIAPTLAALTGVTPPNAEQGEGVNVFAKHAWENAAGRYIITEILLPKYQYGWSPLLGVRQGKWQLVEGNYAALYDLDRDPRELTDLADSESTVVEQLQRMLQPIAEASDEESARLQLSRSEIDQLAALGYAGSEALSRPDALDPREMIFAHVEFESARNFIEVGNDELALEALDKAAEQDPNNVTILLERAKLNLREGKLDLAREDLATCMRLDPENAGVFATMTTVEMAARNFDKAIELATIGSTKRGAFETLTVLKARALAASGREDEGVRIIDEHLADSPNDPELLCARGDFSYADDKLEEAEEFFRKAIANDALHAQSRFRLAQLLAQTDRKPEAVAALESLLKIQPSNPRALSMIGEIKIEDPNSARAYLEESVRLEPENYQALVNLGRVYLELGLGTKAESALLRALEVRVGDPSARNNLAVALILQKRLNEAEQLLMELLEERPQFAEARNNLSLTLGRLGRLEDAEKEARRAIEDDESLLDARLTLASILIATERGAEAVPVLEGFSDQNAEQPDFAKQFGLALVAAERPSEALTWLTTAERSARGPKTEIMFGLGEAYEALGDRAKARTYFERAARIARDAKDRNAALEAVERVTVGG